MDGSLSLDGWSSSSCFRDFLTGAGDLLREDSDTTRFLGIVILGDSDRSMEFSDSLLADSFFFFNFFFSLRSFRFGLGDGLLSDSLDSLRGFLVVILVYLHCERDDRIGFVSSSESFLPSFQKIYSPLLSLSFSSFW